MHLQIGYARFLLSASTMLNVLRYVSGVGSGSICLLQLLCGYDLEFISTVPCVVVQTSQHGRNKLRPLSETPRQFLCKPVIGRRSIQAYKCGIRWAALNRFGAISIVRHITRPPTPHLSWVNIFEWMLRLLHCMCPLSLTGA